MTNSNNDNKENIKVVIRIRPRIERENDLCNLINVEGNRINLLNKTEKFGFDYVATQETTQLEIFENCAKEIADYTLQGYNGSLFVYGQTSAGKTYTLLGSKLSTLPLNKKNINLNTENEINISQLNKLYQHQEWDTRGILPRTIEYLIEKSKTQENSTITYFCSFLEIYNEQLFDLIDSNNGKKLEIRESNDMIQVDGIKKVLITNYDDALSLVNKGKLLFLI